MISACGNSDKFFGQAQAVHVLTLRQILLQRRGGRRPRARSRFPCPYCEKTFATAGMTKAHALCHLTEQPHPCPQCDHFFRTVYDLSHQLVTQGPSCVRSVPRPSGQPGFCITTRSTTWRTVTTPLRTATRHPIT